MLFHLKVTSSHVSSGERTKLEALGFVFDENGYKDWMETPPTIKIDVLEELITFIKEWGTIVMSEDEIEIYNDYRE